MRPTNKFGSATPGLNYQFTCNKIVGSSSLLVFIFKKFWLIADWIARKQLSKYGGSHPASFSRHLGRASFENFGFCARKPYVSQCPNSLNNNLYSRWSGISFKFFSSSLNSIPMVRSSFSSFFLSSSEFSISFNFNGSNDSSGPAKTHLKILRGLVLNVLKLIYSRL